MKLMKLKVPARMLYSKNFEAVDITLPVGTTVQVREFRNGRFEFVCGEYVSSRGLRFDEIEYVLEDL